MVPSFFFERDSQFFFSRRLIGGKVYGGKVFQRSTLIESLIKGL
jgi:hypothetical protein